LVERANVGRAAILQLLRIDHVHRNRHVLERLLAALGCDDDDIVFLPRIHRAGLDRAGLRPRRLVRIIALRVAGVARARAPTDSIQLVFDMIIIPSLGFSFGGHANVNSDGLSCAFAAVLRGFRAFIAFAQQIGCALQRTRPGFPYGKATELSI
jgi:hypothetical protein